MVSHEEVKPSWSALFRVYVGPRRSITVTEFTETLVAVQRREGLEMTESRARTYQRLAGTHKGTQPDAVWEEAVALRSKAPWLSGLLGLLAAAHFAEATGVIAYSEIPVDAGRFLAMIDSDEAAVYISPFDHVLPIDSTYFSVGVSPNNLKPFIESRTIILENADGRTITEDSAINTYVVEEAARLERRCIARKNWDMPTEAHDAFAAGHRSWLQRRGVPKLARHLRRAYMTARDSTFPEYERKILWHEDVTRWIFAHLHEEEPTGFGLIQLADMMTNPYSRIAREVQTALKIGVQGNKALRHLVNQARRGLKDVQLNSEAFESV